MKILNVFLVAAIAAMLLSCTPAKPKTDSFREAVIGALTAFSHKDTAAIRLMTDNETGLYVIYRNGTFDVYSAVSRVDFSDTIHGSLALIKFAMDSNIVYGKLPEYSCESEQWSKTGLFCDTTTTDHLLSQTALNMNTYLEANIPSTEIEKFKGIEKVSRRIVLTDGHGGDFVFYLGYIRSKWCITIIDRVSSDCSA